MNKGLRDKVRIEEIRTCGLEAITQLTKYIQTDRR